MSGWGNLTWGSEYWGSAEQINVGWGAKSFNDGAWGNLQDETVSLTGFSLTSSVGDGTNMGVP